MAQEREMKKIITSVILSNVWKTLEKAMSGHGGVAARRKDFFQILFYRSESNKNSQNNFISGE